MESNRGDKVKDKQERLEKSDNGDPKRENPQDREIYTDKY